MIKLIYKNEEYCFYTEVNAEINVDYYDEEIADKDKLIKDLVTALERIEAQERDLLIISGDTKEGVSLHIASKALEAARKAGMNGKGDTY